MNKATIFTLNIAMLITAGCGDDSATNTQPVTVNFAAKVGAQPFVCDQAFTLGANDTSLSFSDFRFFVYDVELRNADGDYVAIELDDTNFQSDGVALLDFEDCSDMGNTAMNSEVVGVVDEGVYDAIRFKMGVPFDINHANRSIAPAPFNLSTLHWDWQDGYKFLRIDSGTFQMTDWRLHLGSRACDGDPLAGGTTSCDIPNRVEVELAGFDPTSDTVVADLQALTNGAPLDVNQMMTPPGCMSGPTDSDCAPLFGNLGLPFDGAAGGTQSFFSIE